LHKIKPSSIILGYKKINLILA